MRHLVGSLALLAGCGMPVPGGGAPPDLASPDGAATGGCAPACTPAAPHCNPQGHCVICGADQDCPSGMICKVLNDHSSLCAPGCSSDERCRGAGGPTSLKCCNMKCIDTATDAANCGGCGMACNADHASATCAAGACTLGPCAPGFGDCDKDPKDGCEANLHIDPANCTACGMKCAIPGALNACADGCYEAACNFGFDDCNADPMDGCETAVSSDPANCGGCGQTCKSLPNATANCMSAACVLGSCNPGFSDCNGDPKDGCEVGLKFDKKNCGQCGTACPMNAPYCNNGACGNVGNKVLVVYAASMNYGTDVQARLKATQAFSAVDLMAASGMTPTLVQLQPYDALLVFSDGSFQNPAGLGDVVAAYFEQGGRVVVATFSNASVPITGGWTKYQLVMPGGQDEPNDKLGKLDEPQSPLLTGVQTLAATAAYRSTGGAINGGVVVAEWATGKPLVVRGVFKGRNVVSLNFYPPSSGMITGRMDFWTGDGDKLMRNALLFN